MTLKIRTCTKKDLPTLCHISKKTFADAFEHLNKPGDFQLFIESAFTMEKIGKELEHPNSFFFFVYDDETLVGYFKLNEYGAQSDVHDPNAIELERIYVLEGFQGRNIGRFMLEATIKFAKERNMVSVWLGVWDENVHAIRFYERYGFKKFGRHSFWVGNDEQTDVLMRLPLN